MPKARGKKNPKNPTFRPPRPTSRTPTPPPTQPAPEDDDTDRESVDVEEEAQQSDAQDEEVPCSQPSKRRKASLILSDDQEEDVIEWLKEHPVLYTKTMRDYKDRAKKMQLWEEKAKEMGLLNGMQLLTWYESMRTRLGKLTRSKSGDGAKELTERQQWVLDKFDFLLHHISRSGGRQAVNVSKM